jgi:hypothetical protein
MKFLKIEEIRWESNEGGEAFGGYIYSMSIQMGYSEGPTRVTLNIVNETGNYEIKDKDGTKSTWAEQLSTSETKKLTLGNLSPMHLHLVSYEIRTTVGQRILTLQLVDTSVLLDKVFVGLINRHVQANELSPNKARYGKTLEDVEVDLKVRCLKCDGTSETELVSPGDDIAGAKDSDGKQLEYSKVLRDIDVVQSGRGGEIGLGYVEPNDVSTFRKNGGMMILGKEGFVEQVCDIPEVDYNFSELLETMDPSSGSSFSSKFGVYIKVKDADVTVDPPTKTLFDRNTQYRQQYTGTLREVLNAWCADFGFSFTWDLYKAEPTIVGLDLSEESIVDKETESATKGQRYIDVIKDIVTKLNSETGEIGTIAESTTESASLENTFKSGYVSQYLKAARTKEIDRTLFKKKMFYNVPIEAITTDAERGGMPMDQFIITCALAKYSQELRKHYLYTKGLGYNWVREALGINTNIIQKLTAAEEDAIIVNDPNLYKDMSRKYKFKAGGFSMYLIQYDDDKAAEFEQWQSNIANNFMGQYYYSPVEQAEVNSKACGADSEDIYETEVVAGGQVEQYEMNNEKDFAKLPYADIMKSANGHQLQRVIPYIDVKRKDEQGYNPDFFLPSGSSGTAGNTNYEWKTKRVHMFRKEAPWGLPQEAMDEWKTGLPISDFNVTIMDLTGTARLMFHELIQRNLMGAATKKTLEDHDNLKLLIVPASGGMAKAFSVQAGLRNETYLGGASSRNYSPHYFNGAYLGNMFEKVFASQDESDTSGYATPECVTKCETSVVEGICGKCNWDSDVNKMYVGFPEWTGWKYTEDSTIANPKMTPIGVKAEYVMIWSAYTKGQPSFGGPVTTLFPTLIFPVMQPYQGYTKFKTYKKLTIPAEKRILGSALPKNSQDTVVEYDPVFGLNGADNEYKTYTFEDPKEYKNKFMGIRVLENLITNDADTIINANKPDEQIEGIVQLVLPFSNTEQLQKYNEDSGKGKLKTVTLEQYHSLLYDKFKEDAVGSAKVAELFSFTLAGLDFSGVPGLTEMIDPAKGLLNMGVSIDENGTAADLSFGTKPPVYPKAQVFMKKIEPKMNLFGRK